MGIKSIHLGCSIKNLEEHYHLPHEVVKIKSIHSGCGIKNLEEHYHLPHEVDFTRSLSLFATLEPCVVFIAFLLHKRSLPPHTLFQYLFLGSPTPKPMQSHTQKYARKNRIKGHTHKLVRMEFNKCKIKTK
jgi:hypothetical protein